MRRNASVPTTKECFDRRRKGIPTQAATRADPNPAARKQSGKDVLNEAIEELKYRLRHRRRQMWQGREVPHSLS